MTKLNANEFLFGSYIYISSLWNKYQRYLKYFCQLFFQDFGINGTQDLAMIFDRIVKTVIDPVLSKVKAFKTLIQSYDNKGIEYIVNKIIEVIRNVPLILKNLIQKAVDAVMKVVEYGGTPWIDQIKKIVTKIRYFVEDVKEDITNFYSVIILNFKLLKFKTF